MSEVKTKQQTCDPNNHNFLVLPTAGKDPEKLFCSKCGEIRKV